MITFKKKMLVKAELFKQVKEKVWDRSHDNLFKNTAE